MKALDKVRRFDLGVALPALLLLATGPLLIALSGGEDAALAPRQVMWIVVSCIVGIPVALISYTRLLPLAPLLWVIGIGSLVAVRLFAPAINGARRWFVLGGVSIQPSEFMKLAAILTLAWWLRRGPRLEEAGRWFVVLAICALPAGLVLVQPDLGTTLLFVPIAFGALLVGGLARGRLVALVFALAVCVWGGLEHGLADYQRERILSTFRWEELTPAQRWNTAYQLTQSLARISAGGVSGVAEEELPPGLEGGLPHRHNDFIFTVMTQRAGFLGGVILIALQLWLVVAILRVAQRTRDPGGRVLCTGIGVAFGAQSAIHFAVTMGVAPTTGMPLPLVSYGGSSLLVACASLALVQNVAMHPHRSLDPRRTR